MAQNAPGALWLQQQQHGAGSRYPNVASAESLSSLAAAAASVEPSRRPANIRMHRHTAFTAGSTEGVALDAAGTPLPTAGGAVEPLHRDGRPQHRPSGNERLYEAYNDLHALAQVCEKPFDAPAILVVGHQTDGKSALVEALMGFQFNSVGGGTKTRRPVTLHMKYDAAAVQPICYLLNDDLTEQEMGLQELQAVIDQENARLEGEQLFWSKELVVKVQYRSCPNLTIIDLPGLISAAPGKKNATLQGYSRQVEEMVRAKMEQREYIILALEDSNDWSNATTRRLVMQVDPNLARTVLVSTKFDTRLPQFARAADVETYLHPVIDSAMLGGSPFFTSVPSGRVGTGKDSAFATNEHFRDAVAERELQDVAEVEAKTQRRLEKNERSHVGVGQLRKFLEQLLQRRYLESVPSIVPLLEREGRQASARLAAVTQELNGLGPQSLKEKGRGFVESFLTKLQVILRGTATAPPETFGETLADEHIRGGAFVDNGGAPLPVPEGLHNEGMRLFGGAQFHRAMGEFRLAVGAINCPDITREEIVNACGVDDFHDGVNYMRTACAIAVTKGRELFEPFVHQLGYRLSHVLRRLLPIALHLLQRDGLVPPGHDAFLNRVGSAFHTFIDETEKACKARCLEDLQSTTRYVTWSLHTKSQKSLRSMIAKIKLPESARPTSSGSAKGAGPLGAVPDSGSPQGVMADLLETTLWNRSLNGTSEDVVAALVCQIFEGIRDHIVQQAELKFHCFFLMELVDSFPARLRNQLEAAFEQDVDEVFDVGTIRRAMEAKTRSLQVEVQQVERLQRKFANIHSTLAQQLAGAAAAARTHCLADVDSSIMSLTESVPAAPSGQGTGPGLLQAVKPKVTLKIHGPSAVAAKHLQAQAVTSPTAAK